MLNPGSMKVLPLLSILMAFTLVGCAEPQPGPAIPVVASSAQMREIVADIPDKYLGVGDVAFLGDALFVGTNVGLMRIHGQKVEAIYQWFKSGNSIAGPWYGSNRSQIWATRLKDRYLIRFDGKDWARIEPPHPPEGDFGPGQLAIGYEGVGKGGNFYVVGAKHAWVWTNSGEWELRPSPPPGKSGGIIAVAELGDNLLYVVGCASPFLACGVNAYWYSTGRFMPPVPLTIRNVEQVVSASNAVFIRSEKGELVRIVGQESSLVDSPGYCEAIVRATDGFLLASFTGKGIYRFNEKWVKLWDSPYPAVGGDHAAYLAERNGIVALALAKVILTNGTNQGNTASSDSLWVSEGGRFEQVDLFPIK